MGAKSNGNGDKTVPDLVLSDATPLSLGIQVKGKVMSVVIPRKTPLPTKKAKLYITSVDNQSSMCIKVFQGERTKSTDNYLLGEFIVPGIPLAPKGVEKLEACFEIDDNGTLKVRVKVLSTGTIEKITVTDVNGKRSKKEINKMIEDGKKYRFQDQEYKRKVDAYNAFDDYIYLMKNKVKDHKIRKKLSLEVLKNADDAIAEATKWLTENQAAYIDELELECKKKKLENICKGIEVFKNKNHVLTTFGRYVCLWY